MPTCRSASKPVQAQRQLPKLRQPSEKVTFLRLANWLPDHSDLKGLKKKKKNFLLQSNMRQSPTYFGRPYRTRYVLLTS